MATASLQIQSEITADGKLVLSLGEDSVPDPSDDQVLVRMDAAPINPSDLGLLFGAVDPESLAFSGSDDRPVVTGRVPEKAMGAMAGRIGQKLPVGNEGAGVVVQTGSGDAARALDGRTVAILGGPTYAQYRCVPAALCLPLPDGTSAVDGASCFVNPLTALGMVETLKLEGHKALVHTAAASNLGQMLVKLCQEDGVELVNIVRRPEQAELLRTLGAKYVCDSSDPKFKDPLTDALAETGATLAFDATGGGKLTNTILTCMEAAASRSAGAYNRYGSATHKQVYIYGGLDRSPTILDRTYGTAWGVGGWLMPLFLGRVGAEKAQQMRERVAAEIKTTFASHYTKHVTLAEALQRESVQTYGRQATGEKYLIRPHGA